jgi:hypothetical protein
MLLASNASRYMTGSIVTMDGGFLLTWGRATPQPLRMRILRRRKRGCYDMKRSIFSSREIFAP